MPKKKKYGSPVTIRVTPSTEAELMLMAQHEGISEVHMRSHFFRELVSKECRSLYDRLSSIEKPNAEEKKLLKKMQVMYAVLDNSNG